MGLHKAFPLGRESTRVELRVEAFNVLNKTNFQIPDSNASNIRRDAQGNAIPGGTYGTIRSTYPARQVQLAVKLYLGGSLRRRLAGRPTVGRECPRRS
jgi:hypothetical protein